MTLGSFFGTQWEFPKASFTKFEKMMTGAALPFPSTQPSPVLNYSSPQSGGRKRVSQSKPIHNYYLKHRGEVLLEIRIPTLRNSFHEQKRFFFHKWGVPKKKNLFAYGLYRAYFFFWLHIFFCLSTQNRTESTYILDDNDAVFFFF